MPFIYKNTSFILGEKLGFLRANLAKLFEGWWGEPLLLGGPAFKENGVAVLSPIIIRILKSFGGRGGSWLPYV